ncbi:MAG: FadR/GntR family transcriptional regulator [Acidimicrobiales bacterium]
MEPTVGGNPSPSSLQLFTPVAPGRVSELIVDQIRALIREGRLRPGDRLPSERDLCQQFGVSRVTVRDALRLLEGSGLIDTRVGARGGAFVRVPTGAKIGQGIADMVTMAVLHADEVTEARLVLELGIVPLVCERVTEEDLAELREICARAEEALASGHYDVHYSAEFHMRFARSAHNRALDLLVAPFQGPLRHSLEEAQAIAPSMGKRGVAEHEALIRAVARRDVAGARSIMTRHLGRTARRVRPKPARSPGSRSAAAKDGKVGAGKEVS